MSMRLIGWKDVKRTLDRLHARNYTPETRRQIAKMADVNRGGTQSSSLVIWALFLPIALAVPSLLSGEFTIDLTNITAVLIGYLVVAGLLLGFVNVIEGENANLVILQALVIYEDYLVQSQTQSLKDNNTHVALHDVSVT